MSQQAPNVQGSSARSSGEQAPNRRGAKTYTLVGLLALFVIAVFVVLLSKFLPGRFSRQIERALHRVR